MKGIQLVAIGSDLTQEMQVGLYSFLQKEQVQKWRGDCADRVNKGVGCKGGEGDADGEYTQRRRPASR